MDVLHRVLKKICIGCLLSLPTLGYSTTDSTNTALLPTTQPMVLNNLQTQTLTYVDTTSADCVTYATAPMQWDAGNAPYSIDDVIQLIRNGGGSMWGVNINCPPDMALIGNDIATAGNLALSIGSESRNALRAIQFVFKIRCCPVRSQSTPTVSWKTLTP